MFPPQCRSQLEALFYAAVDAVNPRTLVERVVAIEQSHLIVHPPSETIPQRFPLHGHIFIVGAGKGAGVLAQGLEALLGERITSGAVIVPTGQQLALRRVEVIYGEHPLPGEGVYTGRKE